MASVIGSSGSDLVVVVVAAGSVKLELSSVHRSACTVLGSFFNEGDCNIYGLVR